VSVAIRLGRTTPRQALKVLGLGLWVYLMFFYAIPMTAKAMLKFEGSNDPLVGQITCNSRSGDSAAFEQNSVRASREGVFGQGDPYVVVKNSGETEKTLKLVDGWVCHDSAGKTKPLFEFAKKE